MRDGVSILEHIDDIFNKIFFYLEGVMSFPKPKKVLGDFSINQYLKSEKNMLVIRPL